MTHDAALPAVVAYTCPHCATIEGLVPDGTWSIAVCSSPDRTAWACEQHPGIHGPALGDLCSHELAVALIGTMYGLT